MNKFCLLFLHAKTTEPIWMKFWVGIDYTLDKNIGHFLYRKKLCAGLFEIRILSRDSDKHIYLHYSTVKIINILLNLIKYIYIKRSSSNFCLKKTSTSAQLLIFLTFVALVQGPGTIWLWGEDEVFFASTEVLSILRQEKWYHPLIIKKKI